MLEDLINKSIEARFTSIIEAINQIAEKINNNNEGGNKPDYYRKKDLQKLYGLSGNTITKYRRLGKLPYTHFEGSDLYLYPRIRIEAILNKNTFLPKS